MGMRWLSCRSELGGGMPRSSLRARRCPRVSRGASRPCEFQLSSQDQQPDREVRDYDEEYEVEDECLPGLGSAPSDLDRRDCSQEIEPCRRMVHCEDESNEAESDDCWVFQEVEKVGTRSRGPEGESIDEDEAVQSDEQAGPLADHVHCIMSV